MPSVLTKPEETGAEAEKRVRDRKVNAIMMHIFLQVATITGGNTCVSTCRRRGSAV
jgi:hypothetical protein